MTSLKQIHESRGFRTISASFCIALYYFVQAAVSVIRNSEVVRYSGAATVLNIWRYRLVHTAVSVIW